jgi:hypothetical protein
MNRQALVHTLHAAHLHIGVHAHDYAQLCQHVTRKAAGQPQLCCCHVPLCLLNDARVQRRRRNHPGLTSCSLQQWLLRRRYCMLLMLMLRVLAAVCMAGLVPCIAMSGR